MIYIKQKDNLGEVWTKEIKEVNWFECQSPECNDAIHFDVITASGQMVGVSREEFIRLMDIIAPDYSMKDIPRERTKDLKGVM